MKLYYSPGACSLSPHIALIEAGAKFEAVKVGKDKRAEDGRDFREVNPFGYVPALVTDEGPTLLEGPAIVQYIADKFPQAKLAPPNGTLERYQLQSALGFVNSEIHKTAGGLFKPGLTDEEREQVVDKLDTRFKQLAVWRQGKEQALKLRIGEQEEAEKQNVSATGPAKKSQEKDAPVASDVEQLGLTLQKVTDQLRERYGLSDNVKGVVITKVAAGSPAAEKQLLAGDVILEVDQKPVTTPQEVAELVGKLQAQKKRSVLLFLERQGDPRFAALRLTK